MNNTRQIDAANHLSEMAFREAMETPGTLLDGVMIQIKLFMK